MHQTRPSDPSATDRRSSFKTGELVAAGIVASPRPAEPLRSRAMMARRLARLEDERAIKRLQRAFLRRFNGARGVDCREFLARADAVELDAGVCAVAEEPGREGRLAFADDGRGQGRHRRSEIRTLRSELAETGQGGWVITHLALA